MKEAENNGDRNTEIHYTYNKSDTNTLMLHNSVTILFIACAVTNII
jgi:hypothetical protein